MTKKPETKFWKRIKANATNIHWTRIEAITPVGIPDLNGLFNDPKKGCGEFWVHQLILLNFRRGKYRGTCTDLSLEENHLSWPRPSDEETSLCTLGEGP